MKMIGIWSVERSANSAETTSHPETRGIMMSSKMRFGGSLAIDSSASSPSAASRTLKPAASRFRRQTVRIGVVVDDEHCPRGLRMRHEAGKA